MPRPSDQRNNLGGLCLIIDEASLRIPAGEALSAALAAGVRFVQYRNKQGARRRIFETARDLAARCREHDALFIVNDHADIAAATGADGVHLGQDDLPLPAARTVLGPDRIIGLSTHSIEQALEARAAGADYIGFGPVFSTATKDAGTPRGLESLRAVVSRITIPVIAIGGITAENAGEAVRAGAAGVAVISAVLGADDIRTAAALIIAGIAGIKGKK